MNGSDQRAEEIFAAAMEIADAAERGAYLERAYAGDDPLRREVESLLAADAQASGFLEGPPTEVVAAANAAHSVASLAEGPGTRIGRYKLLKKIGEGGFGGVWMAERRRDLRQVAQVANLPYRRLPVGLVLPVEWGWNNPKLRRLAALRNSRLAVCATPFRSPLADPTSSWNWSAASRS